MNLLFIDDCKFYKDGDVIYSGGAFPSTMWSEHYLPHYDSITIIGRQSFSLIDKGTVSSINEKQTKFVLISEYKSIRYLFMNFFIIKKKIKNEIFKADMTIVRLPNILAFMGFKLLLKNKKPFIVQIASNSYEAFWHNGSIIGKLSAWYFNNLTKRCAKYASYVIYVAKKLYNDYPTKGKYEIISNVVLTRRLLPEEIEKTRFHNKVIKIGLIGSFSVRYKGQNILLKALSLLDNEIKNNIELYFLGFGDYQWVIALAQKLNLNKNIKYIGQIPHNDVFDFLSTLSLYIQPSFQEGMPRAMLEAMSMGCPVLGSTIGGIPEIMDETYLHIPGDFKKLSAQIQRFYENRTILENEAFHNLERVEPFLKENLNQRRREFLQKINKDNLFDKI